MFVLLSIFNFKLLASQSQPFAVRAFGYGSWRANRGGFLLIEVLIGLALTVILTSIFAFSCVQVWQSVTESRERMFACVFGRSCLELGLAHQRAGEYRMQEQGYVSVVRLSSDGQLKHLMHGTVTVAWPRGTLTLQTGMCV